MTASTIAPKTGPARVPTAAPGERLGPPALADALRDVLGAGAKIHLRERQRLGPGVHRLRLDVDGVERSLVAKVSEPAMARRNRLVAGRWLPAVGLGEEGPPLLGGAAERRGEREWQLFDDLGDDVLDEAAPDERHVAAVVDLVARIHVAFADHPLLAECRLWGTDFGIHWYATNVRDAVRSLGGARPDEPSLDAEAAAVREGLLERLQRLREEEGDRARALARLGGTETLLHGDLWPKNSIVVDTAAGPRARLVDWDRLGVGPVSYDLSTFLARFPPAHRPWILERYRDALRASGLTLPSAAGLNLLFETAELARLAHRVIWPANALREREADRDWALAELRAIAEWIEALEPLLPVH